jgi:hypothetical protein
MGVKINGKKIKLEIQNNVNVAAVSVKMSTTGSYLLQLYYLKIKCSTYYQLKQDCLSWLY